MTTIKTSVYALLTSMFLTGAAQAGDKPLTVGEIMKKVDHEVRRTWETQVALVKLSTCRYTVKQGKMKCKEKPRNVLFRNTLKRADRNKNDVHSLAIVREPIAEKGIGLLTYEYDKRNKDNDNWIYLSELGKVKRVVTSDDASGSMFGSEFTVESTENPEARKLYEFTYKLLGESEFEGRPVWEIEFTPTPEKAARTKYDKVVVLVDKEKFMTVKEDFYLQGHVHKQRIQRRIEKIDGVYVALDVTMRNLDIDRVSKMTMQSVAFHMNIPDDFLTQRALTDFAFREKNLSDLGVYVKKHQL